MKRLFRLTEVAGNSISVFLLSENIRKENQNGMQLLMVTNVCVRVVVSGKSLHKCISLNENIEGVKLKVITIWPILIYYFSKCTLNGFVSKQQHCLVVFSTRFDFLIIGN